MAEHPDFTLSAPTLSTQSLELRNEAGDVVKLVSNDYRDRAVLAGAIETTLALFEVIKKKGH